MLNIQSDSRKIKPGDTFVAVKCEVNDGHKYIESAIKNGASKIVVEHLDKNYDVDTLLVKDTREYLTNYLEEHYNKFLDEMTIIGITGTNGKTTSAYLMYQALNKLGVKAAYMGTIGFYMDGKVADMPNTSVDICDAYDLIMKAYDKGYKTIIMEVSSHALANSRVKTIKYDYALFTNLTQDHLDFHKTMGNYALAKQQLFRQLKHGGIAIVNTDDKYSEYYLLDGNTNLTYGFNDANFKVVDYDMSSTGTKFTYQIGKKKFNCSTKLIGKYNIYNTLCVISVLTCMEFSQDSIIKVLKELEAPNGRMQIVNYKTNTIVIDYAHTADAIEKIMSAIKPVIKGKTYVVFGCTGDRDRLKRPIMTEYVANNSDFFIITNDDPHYEDPAQIVDDMIKDLEKDNYEVCLDREEAIIKGIRMLDEYDCLFILGKGHEEAIVIKDKRIPFNDFKCVKNYLERIGD